MHTSYTTEKITQQRMAETARRARIHADRSMPRRERRTFASRGSPGAVGDPHRLSAARRRLH